MIKNQFSQIIKIFQSDGGGELSGSDFTKHLNNVVLYTNFHVLILQNKTLLLSGNIDIVETGLTLYALRHLWVDAFAAAVFLINRMLIPVLNNSLLIKNFLIPNQITNFKKFRLSFSFYKN